MGITLKKAGWQTIVMDQGRRVTRHLGIPLSGITDMFRYWWANGLVGHNNFAGSGPPVLEIRTGSVEILFDEAHTFAITGSSGEFFLNNIKIKPYQTYTAKKNQVLHIKTISRNGTVYLAIGGKWKLARSFGSASADILSPFSGIVGRYLITGDRIIIDQPHPTSSVDINTPEYIQHSAERFEPIFRIIAGPELIQCRDVKRSLLQNTFTISHKSNRMGYRLEPSQSIHHELSSMVSSVVLPGMIQWPSGNQPILLLPNCQTTGGYPRVAKVIDADIWKLAYVASGDHLRFTWCTHEEARYLLVYEMGQFTQAWNRTFKNHITNHRLMY